MHSPEKNHYQGDHKTESGNTATDEHVPKITSQMSFSCVLRERRWSLRESSTDEQFSSFQTNTLCLFLLSVIGNHQINHV